MIPPKFAQSPNRSCLLAFRRLEYTPVHPVSTHSPAVPTPGVTRPRVFPPFAFHILDLWLKPVTVQFGRRTAQHNGLASVGRQPVSPFGSSTAVHQKRSSRQFPLQFLPVPVYKVDKQRRYRRSATVPLGALEGHPVQKLPHIRRQVDPGGPVRPFFLR